MTTIKLLVLDENEEFLASLAQYTQRMPELEVLGGCLTDIESIGQIEHVPDVLFCASSILGSLSKEQRERIHTRWPDALLYRLTVFDESGYDESGDTGFDGSVPRSGIEKHLECIVEKVQAARIAAKDDT